MYRTVGELIEMLQKHDKNLPVMLTIEIDDPPGYGHGYSCFLRKMDLGPYGVPTRYLELIGVEE